MRLSIRFPFLQLCHWTSPRSLATTNGVSVDFLSCRYWDVSVPCVRLDILWIQIPITLSACAVMLCFHIRKFLDQRLLDSFPGLIAACHVLHRLITPRHPPYTLSSLTTFAFGPNDEPQTNIFKPHIRNVLLFFGASRIRWFSNLWIYWLPYSIFKQLRLASSSRPTP